VIIVSLSLLLHPLHVVYVGEARIYNSQVDGEGSETRAFTCMGHQSFPQPPSI